MSPEEISRLIQPCKNRSLSYEVGNGYMIINGIKFTVWYKAENYLYEIPRTDI